MYCIRKWLNKMSTAEKLFPFNVNNITLLYLKAEKKNPKNQCITITWSIEFKRRRDVVPSQPPYQWMQAPAKLSLCRNISLHNDGTSGKRKTISTRSLRFPLPVPCFLPATTNAKKVHRGIQGLAMTIRNTYVCLGNPSLYIEPARGPFPDRTRFILE